MKQMDVADQIISKMKNKGAEKSQTLISSSDTQQLSLENGRINLLRSVAGGRVFIKAISKQKLGVASANTWDESSLESFCDKAMDMANGSVADSAYDIAPFSAYESFQRGDSSPDLDKMYFRLEEILSGAKKRFPDLKIEKGKLSYQVDTSSYANSNGMKYDCRVANYLAQFTFLARQKQKISSFNYSYSLLDKLDTPLLEIDAISQLMEQTARQLDIRPLGDKFTADVIITPYCLTGFVKFLTDIFLSDQFIIAKRGFMADKLNQSVASAAFSLRASPVDTTAVAPEFVSGDGFKTEEAKLIDKGVLKSFALSLYAANKTGFGRFVGGKSNFVVDAGEISLADQIKKIKRGILLTRYAGSRPNDRGDFSGVAKNSYYIENGEIKYPVCETMVSGNLADLLLNIKSTSKERINFGFGILPWIHGTGITVSGK